MSDKKDRPTIETDLVEIIQGLDALIEHLNKEQQLSKEDIKFLREIIFHLDGLVVKINNKKGELGVLVSQISEDLKNSADHLRNVLLNEEQTSYQHHQEKQKKNNLMFASLISKLKSI